MQSCKKIIYKFKQQTKKNDIVFYELGVGRGLIVNSLLNEKNLSIKGCDIILGQHLKDNPQFDFYEGTFFDALNKINNESIDVFYSNDVLEHICDDEINEHINLIYRKMAKNGIIITITPHRFIGPHDSTRLFFPHGTKAKGFHFCEYSYFEVKKLFVSHGFKIYYHIIRKIFPPRYIILHKQWGGE